MKRLRMNVALSNPMRSEAPELLCRIINVGKGSVTCDSQSDMLIHLAVFQLMCVFRVVSTD